ncbi:MAG TPA: hypothetical protein DEP68_01635 [Erythrobacter sp.]|nr:hypothetical protein [Sphingorhabdus sp.]HCB77459.1 hypothetical protein [Erythrobacter sp.]|tara:strand:+ start:44592 stop:45401 length:810 start_codon:yes stop_codon:yes gene_type:complete
MSGSDFRPRLAGELRTDIERAAKTRGISPSDFIESAVRKELKLAGSRNERASDLKADRQLDRIDRFFGELDSFMGQFHKLLNTTATAIPKQLKTEFDALKTTIVNTGGTGHLRDLLKQLLADFENRQNVRLSKLESAVDQSAQHRATRAAIDDLRGNQNRDRWMLAAGAGACLLVLAAVGFLFADTGPTRWAATRLMGESSNVNSGAKLISENAVIRQALYDTRLLLGSSEEFTLEFADCVDRLIDADQPESCRLEYDPPQESDASDSP